MCFPVLKRSTGRAVGTIQAFQHGTAVFQTRSLIAGRCRQQAVKAGAPLSLSEMQSLIAVCSVALPNTTPSGKPTYTEFKKEGLDKLFGRA
jgi:DNA mismatch repair ATPase MutL